MAIATAPVIATSRAVADDGEHERHEQHRAGDVSEPEIAMSSAASTTCSVTAIAEPGDRQVRTES